jgi:hypothetical protein
MSILSEISLSISQLHGPRQSRLADTGNIQGLNSLRNRGPHIEHTNSYKDMTERLWKIGSVSASLLKGLDIELGGFVGW